MEEQVRVLTSEMFVKSTLGEEQVRGPTCETFEKALELMAAVLLVMVEQPWGEAVVLMVPRKQEGEIVKFGKTAF